MNTLDILLKYNDIPYRVSESSITATNAVYL